MDDTANPQRVADDASHHAAVIAATRDWLERVVIGLDLCPFAKAVQARGQVRFAVSDASHIDALCDALESELRLLAAADPDKIETTLLIVPAMLADFLDYNDFLDIAERILEELELDGELQIASFHPGYRFEGTAEDDIENCTNRSPYPTLHLLREASVERAIAAHPDAAGIYERNIETLKRLGMAGWQALVRAS
jgi:hypothetical protein